MTTTINLPQKRHSLADSLVNSYQPSNRRDIDDGRSKSIDEWYDEFVKREEVKLMA